MIDPKDPIGFFALWRNKRSEFHADPEEEERTTGRIKEVFANARERGIRMFGRYGCRWSTEEQYFTFWICPNLEVLEKTMDELEKAGDFKFADSEHIIGTRVLDEEMLDEDYLFPSEADEDQPLAFFAVWKRTGSYHRADSDTWEALDRSVRQVFETARAQGVRMLGRYDCRWSTSWDFFTFWTVPNFEVLEITMDQLEQAGDFWFADSRHIIGNLEPRFRFGRHLQAADERLG